MIVVELLDEDPDAMNEICNQFPFITRDIIVRFEQIGRKQISPKLLLSDTPGTRRLLNLPFSAQEKYADEPLELLVNNNGKAQTLLVGLNSLTAAQAAQVFSGNGVRSIAEQRSYLFDKQEKTTFPALSEISPYKIKGATVQFREACTLNAKELTDILARLN